MSETLRVTILGAGGSSPPAGYAGPAVLVEDGGARLLLDCGEGCVERLRRLGYSPCDIDAVYVTHTHADHWSGVFTLMVARVAEGCRELTLYTPPGAEELATLLEKLKPSSAVLRVERVDGAFHVGRLEARLAPVSHSAPCHAVGVYAGGELKLVYTGDTRLDESVTESLSRLGKPRLLVAEANFPTGYEELARETGHMTVGQAFELMRLLGAELLIPVHLTPLSLRQLRSYRMIPRGVIIPSDGVSVTL